MYDATTSKIYSIDDTLGAVTGSSNKLKISAANLIKIEFYNMVGGGENPFSFTKTVSLPKFVIKGKVALNAICLVPLPINVRIANERNHL